MPKKYRVLYYDEVNQDIIEAKQWYKVQQPGLEVRFAKDIKALLQHLQVLPYSHAIRYGNIRVAHPSVFPYAVHYNINEERKQVEIIAIVHNLRDPHNVKQRGT